MELDYFHNNINNKVVLFTCLWYNVDLNVWQSLKWFYHFESEKLVIREGPLCFFASQANQVFYIEELQNSKWNVAIHFLQEIV